MEECNCNKRSCSPCNSRNYRIRKEKNPERFKEYAKTTRANNLEKMKEKRRRLYIQNREKELNQSHDYHVKNREALYFKKIKRLFNISIDEYKTMWDNQEGNCAICKSQPERDLNLCLDHCHETGKVRGLLCTKCNKALGLFKDNKEKLLDAIKYLEKNE